MSGTPADLLHKLCSQHGVHTPYFDMVPHESDPKMFSCICTAFNLTSRGSARSKKLARQEACANLLDKLKTKEQFKDEVQAIPEAKKPVTTRDAVMHLRDICVQRQLPLPTFKEFQSCGATNTPSFTYICQLSTIKRTGTYSSKVEAKQKAAVAMIELIQTFEQNEEQKEIASTLGGATSSDADTTPKFLDLVKSKDGKLQYWAPHIFNRHKYFLQLPKVDRDEAKKILQGSTDITSMKKVELVCTALKLKYGIKSIPDHPENFMVFHLFGNHDCVIAAKEDELENFR
ncbi:uncharacterized protein LOC116337112 isoform X2 [Contarinia nasturtii]|uniref:uncharacterized protein LOC116337112 isoform X2 n=1 Tax=Contarinia nasturtii TaxID=265458 RepID=UPI0012D37ACC|nr:uncharacterized protein LOC116337112 isoform X2 [Contarinia nasturtii]